MSWKVQMQDAEVLPAVVGSVVAVNCNTTPLVIDLANIPRTKADGGAATALDADQTNPIGKYIRIHAEAGDVYYATGNSINAVSNIAAASRTAVNGTTGAVTVTANECEFVPQGSFIDVLVPPGPAPKTTPYGATSPCRYLALVTASSTAVARVFQTSR